MHDCASLRVMRFDVYLVLSAWLLYLALFRNSYVFTKLLLSFAISSFSCIIACLSLSSLLSSGSLFDSSILNSHALNYCCHNIICCLGRSDCRWFPLMFALLCVWLLVDLLVALLRLLVALRTVIWSPRIVPTLVHMLWYHLVFLANGSVFVRILVRGFSSSSIYMALTKAKPHEGCRGDLSVW